MLGDDFVNVIDGAVERTIVLQLDGTHRRRKLACLCWGSSQGTLVEIACRVGVAASSGIHDLVWGVGWNLVEGIIDIDERALAAQCDDYFGDTPGVEQLGSLMGILQTSDGLHFDFVHLEIVGVFEHFQFILPVDGIHFLVSYLTQVSLHVDRYLALLGEIFHHLVGEVVAQKTTQVIYLGIHVLQLLDGERVSLGEYSLLAFVLVLTIDVLEENGVARSVECDIDASLAHLLRRFRLRRIHGSDQREGDIIRELVDGVSKIKRSAACHIDDTMRCHNLILGDVTNATNIFHYYHYYILYGSLLGEDS